MFFFSIFIKKIESILRLISRISLTIIMNPINIYNTHFSIGNNRELNIKHMRQQLPIAIAQCDSLHILKNDFFAYFLLKWSDEHDIDFDLFIFILDLGFDPADLETINQCSFIDNERIIKHLLDHGLVTVDEIRYSELVYGAIICNMSNELFLKFFF